MNFAYLVILAILLAGCVTINDNSGVNQNNGGNGGNETIKNLSVDGTPPYLSTSSIRPSNPDRNEPFKITITAEDDVAVNFISWETNDSFSRQPSSQTEDCDLQKTCSVEFEFASGEDGLKTVSVYATDSSGNESQKSGFEVSVRPFDYIPSICGDDICKSSESFETCPADCEELIPDCGDDCASEITGSEGLTGGSEETCTTDSSCGYKKACIGGKCTSVQCTNDAQCGSGKECENNRCARCPVGASGFYAC